VCIPRHLADEVAQDAIAQEQLETFVLRKIQAGAPLIGTYPPSKATRDEYEASRGSDA
jgi:regulator of RNase E activity RraA